ncbi:WxL protein peptidoglycan domain-containing protein [Glycomyces sp. NPDC048151]|uniref:WxL protein peptidoglycan domain-containing protein n=1 Tax=Glycomyces sp. NPDC048151 TaxID=3364002 RepID=UPI00370F7B30
MMLPSTPARAVRVLCAVAAAFLVVSGPALPAAAQSAEDTGTVTWSVRPADEAGEDGRAWVEQELDPGETATEHMAVRNLSGEEVTFRLSAADGYFQENGRFSMLPSDQESVDSGLWIAVQEEVTVGPDETVIVPFTTTVPENATPGDHAAGIAASVLSEQVGEDGATVGVESRVGFRVMTRVTGELAPAASVEAVSSTFDLSWNPLSPGAAQVTFEVVNTGNARLLVTGAVAVGGREVAFPGPDEIDQELLPGDRRTFTVTVDDVWPLVFVPGSVTVTPTVVGEGEGTAIEPVTADAGFWAVPWPQLLTLAGIALLVVSSLRGRRKARTRLEGKLEEAREEGRREALKEDA